MFKNIIRISFFAFFILFLFVLSEAVFIWKHPTQLTAYGFSLAKLKASTDNVSGSLVTLRDSANYFHKLNTNVKVDENNFFILVPTLGEEFKNDYSNYIKNLPYIQLFQNGYYDFSRVLYEVGLLAYIHDHKSLTYNFWTIANTIDPTLSYWSVELSNLYLVNGDREISEKILEKCMTLPAPEKHCREFLSNNILANIPLEPGFLLVESEKYYKFKSFLITKFPEKFVAE